MNNRELAIRVLGAGRELQVFEDKLQDVGLDANESIISEQIAELCGLTLDILGVPEDTYDDATGEGNCRDYWLDDVFSAVFGDSTVEECVDNIIVELGRLQ